MKTKFFMICMTLLIMSYIIHSQEYTQVLKALAEVRQSLAYFGYSVDISGNYAIVGAPYETSMSGVAYIFERNENGSWALTETLTADDGNANDFFGMSVSISGQFAVVGAQYEDEDEGGVNTRDDAGSVYVFRRNASAEWNQVEKIVASDRGEYDNFGNSVSICNDYLIIGAYNEDHDEYGLNGLTNSGSVYIYERTPSGTFVENHKIVAPDRILSASFGKSVDVSGQFLIVGAPFDDNDESGGNSLNSAGSVYIYKRNNTTNLWEFEQKIVPSDRDEGDFFGYSVSMDDDQILVGAKNEDENTSGVNTLTESGSAYFYTRTPVGIWGQEIKIVSSDRSENSYFGNSVCLSGNKAIIGANEESAGLMLEYGAAYIFEKNETWEEIQKLTETNPRNEEDYYGNSVAIDNDYAIIGAYGEREDENESNSLLNAGAAYLFENCTASGVSNPDNVIENDDFETCILAPWSFFNAYDQDAIGTYQLSEGRCIIRPGSLNSSPEMWHIQLEQALSTSQINMLEENEQYILSFDASSEVDNRDCHIYFGQNETPYSALLDTVFQLQTISALYSFEFTVSQVYSLMKLAIDSGTETNWMTIDNVSLIKKAPSEFPKYIDTDIFKVIYYPSDKKIRIFANEGSVIRLISSTGIVIVEFISHNNITDYNASNLEHGMYVISISKGDDISMDKVIVL